MFGKGNVQITISGTNYSPGDTISGDVALTLKKPVKATEVSISLIGEQTITRSGIMGAGGQGSKTTEHIRIYDFKQKLDGEKEYSEGREYRFEIKIPADILGMKPQLPEMEGALGQGLRMAQTAAAMIGAISSQRTKWYLLAKLDIPGGLDIKEKADIVIA
ncbi:MAG: hypothetical protein FJZ93_08755 [Chloroflexi bacterium]|nr:hypothetical protein [Chloroflexota bacterium]